jgi:Domain of unknown function (DUF4189)
LSLQEKLGDLMRKLVWALALATAVVPHSGFATGAIAVTDGVNVAKVGWSYGTVVGHPSEDDASTAALAKCRSSLDAAKSPALRKACVVTQTFHDQCAAIAMDPGAGTPGVGWGIAATMQAAENQALEKCRATAGPSRAKFCQVAINNAGDNAGQAAVNCDGSAK